MTLGEFFCELLGVTEAFEGDKLVEVNVSKLEAELHLGRCLFKCRAMLVVLPAYFRTALQWRHIILPLSDLTKPKCFHTNDLKADPARSISDSASIVFVYN